MADSQDAQAIMRRIVERTDLDSFADEVLGTLANIADATDIAWHPPMDEARFWVRWNIDLSIRWFVDGQSPTESEIEALRAYARAMVANGAPAETILMNYRAASRYVWEALLLELATDEERPIVLQRAGMLIEFVERVTRVFSQAYNEEVRKLPYADDDRRAQSLLNKLGSSEDLVSEDIAFAEKIGFSIEGPFVPFVTTSPKGTISDHADHARRLRGRSVLASSHFRQVNAVANSPLNLKHLELGPNAVHAEGTVTSRHHLRSAFEELFALVDVAVARNHSGVVALDDYPAEMLLHQSQRTTGRIYDAVFGKLEAEHPELARTLESFISHDFDRGKTAESIPVHRNTLTQRLERITSLTGLDFNSARGLGLAWLAYLASEERLKADNIVNPFQDVI